MFTINIEGIIGWEIENKDIREKLEEANGEDVIVNIASPGGMISEGLLIYNELKNYSGNVNTHLAGSVASMASYIAMIGTHRTAENNAVFMIHNGSGLAIGDYRVMLKYGAHLDSLTNIIAKEMALKSETDLAEIRTAMDETTFYYGDEIKEAGFVHEMVGEKEPEDRAEAIAMAELLIEECRTKVNKPDSIKKDMESLATMLADEPKPKKIFAKEITMVSDNKQPQEVKIMNLEQLKTEHPELYNELMALGQAKGINQERARVKTLVEMRAKFPKEHSQKVIDEAIMEGHELNQVSINLMSADQVAAEVAAAQADEATPPGGGADDVPEMKDGQMTHPDHVDAVGAEIANLPGVI